MYTMATFISNNQFFSESSLQFSFSSVSIHLLTSVCSCHLYHHSLTFLQLLSSTAVCSCRQYHHSLPSCCYNLSLWRMVYRSFLYLVHLFLDPVRHSRPTEHQPLSFTLVTCLFTVLTGHLYVPVSLSALLFQTGTLSHYSSGIIHGPASFYTILRPSLMMRPFSLYPLIPVTKYTASSPFYLFLLLSIRDTAIPPACVYILVPSLPHLFSFFSSRFFYASTRHLLS